MYRSFTLIGSGWDIDNQKVVDLENYDVVVEVDDEDYRVEAVRFEPNYCIEMGIKEILDNYIDDEMMYDDIIKEFRQLYANISIDIEDYDIEEN